MRYALLLGCCALTSAVSAQLYTTAADGPWNDPATWACTCVPSVADSVEIAHHVTIANSITLTNAWVHITPSGWFGFSVPGFLAITQPVLNEGTLHTIGDLDVDWTFDSPGYIEVNGDLFNDDSINIGNAGLIRVNGNMRNDGVIAGGGAICVSDMTINNGALLGHLDFCDASPTVLTPPFIDQSTGTVDPNVVFCDSGKCTVGIGEGPWSSVAVGPNPADDRLRLTGLPEGPLRFDLLDAMGRTCPVQVSGGGAARSLDLALLATGGYLLRVCGGEGCRSFRVIKD